MSFTRGVFALVERVCDESPVDRDGTGEQKKARTYDYTVSVRFCLEKGDEVLAPEKTMDFHGTVVMKKKGWFRWLLDGVTLGE